MKTSASDILVVDDDWPTADFITELLSDEGYTVRTAWDMKAALAAVNTHMPSLILLDLQRTGSSTTLLTLLRKDGAHDIPIILMSAEVHPPAAAILGATAFLAKPFDIEDILQLVEQHIGKSMREPDIEMAV